MTKAQQTSPRRDGGPGRAVEVVVGQGRRRFLKTLAASPLGVFAVGRSLQADSGGGGGGSTANPLVGSWFTIISPLNSALNYPTVVTFNTNGQFNCVQTNPLTGQPVTIQGGYALGPLPTTNVPYLTLVTQGQIVLQGLFAQPGPGEFIIETTPGPLTGTGFILFNRQ